MKLVSNKNTFFKFLAFANVILIILFGINTQAIAQKYNVIAKAVSISNKIYAIGDGNLIYIIDKKSKTSHQIASSEKIIDICVSNGSLLIVGAKDEQRKNLVISQLKENKLHKIAYLDIKNSLFQIINCEQKSPIIATNDALYFLYKSKFKKIDFISKPKNTKFFGKKTSNITDNKLFIGYSRGEWGGALYQINLKNAEFKVIEEKTSELCGGVFNPSCDPVNSIITSPWNKNCIVFSSGLAHLLYNGKIIEHCNNHTKIIFEDDAYNSDKINDKFYEGQKLPFYGIIENNNKIIAIAEFGIYSIDNKGNFEKTPFKEFSKYGIFDIDDKNKDFILLSREIDVPFSKRTEPIIIIAGSH